jgi:CRP/FNR family cyclic AMP-dependent transcriptional regulator
MSAPLKAVPMQPQPTQQQQRKLKRGELLFAEGESSRGMYLLKSGMIRIFKKKGDSCIEIDTVHSGQILGELAFLDGNPRSASGEALTDCELVEISGPAFVQTLSEMPPWLKILLKTVVGRLRTASTRIRQLEQASTAVDYAAEKTGKRALSYVFLSPTDVLKVLSAILLVGSRNGQTLRMGLVQRYANQIMGIPAAKISAVLDALSQIAILSETGSATVLQNADALEELIAYINEENLAEPSKRHDMTPRAFVMMGQIANSLPLFPKDEATGLSKVNLAKIYDKENLRLDDFMLIATLGYATAPDMKSAEEIYTYLDPERFARAARLQQFNEQKRSNGLAGRQDR